MGDRGGFVGVYIASSPETDVPAVAKLVPKAPGAERELLFVDLGGARNVVPVLDAGEVEDDYVLVMERAEKSLRQHLHELQLRAAVERQLYADDGLLARRPPSERVQEGPGHLRLVGPSGVAHHRLSCSAPRCALIDARVSSLSG